MIWYGVREGFDSWQADYIPCYRPESALHADSRVVFSIVRVRLYVVVHSGAVSPTVLAQCRDSVLCEHCGYYYVSLITFVSTMPV